MTEPTQDDVQGLAAVSVAGIAATERLIERIDRDSRQRQRMIRLILAVLLAVAVMVFLLLSGRTQSRDISKAILSCTDPAGECAKRGQAGQAAAVGQIIDFVARNQVLIVGCAVEHPGDLAGYDACVAAALPDLRDR